MEHTMLCCFVEGFFIIRGGAGLEQIVIINEQTPFREGLKKLLEIKFGNQYEIKTIDCRQLLTRRKVEKIPFLVIIDHVFKKEAEDILYKLKNRGSRIVILSEMRNIRDCNHLELFDGILLKNMRTNDLLNAIQQILQNGLFVHPEMGGVLLKKYTSLLNN